MILDSIGTTDGLKKCKWRTFFMDHDFFFARPRKVFHDTHGNVRDSTVREGAVFEATQMAVDKLAGNSLIKLPK